MIAIPLGFLVLLFALLAIPGLVPHHEQAHRAVCVNNLKLIENAEEKWASEHGKKPSETPTDQDLFGTNAYFKEKPTCPDGGAYDLGAVGEKPGCSLATKGHKLE